MPVLRIQKKYNNRSPLNGMVVEDRITFDTKEGGARFLAAVTLNRDLDYEILGYEWALIDLTSAHGERVMSHPLLGKR